MRFSFPSLSFDPIQWQNFVPFNPNAENLKTALRIAAFAVGVIALGVGLYTGNNTAILVGIACLAFCFWDRLNFVISLDLLQLLFAPPRQPAYGFGHHSVRPVYVPQPVYIPQPVYQQPVYQQPVLPHAIYVPDAPLPVDRDERAPVGEHLRRAPRHHDRDERAPVGVRRRA